MDWKILAAISVISLTAVVFIDNYITDVYFKGRDAAAVKLFYGLGFTIIGPILMLIAGLIHGFSLENFSVILILFISGAVSSVSSIPYYRALELDESTNISIFYQLAPIFYLIGECLFFNATFEPIKLFAFLLIIMAPVLIIATTRKKHREKKVKAFLFAVLYVITSVVGHLLFLKGSLEYKGELNILMCMGVVLFAKGIANLIIVYVFNPKWAKRFHDVVRSSKRKVYKPLYSYLAICIVYEFSHRIALVLAPAAAIASAAMDSTEPIVVFFMGIILTLVWPKFGREKLDARTIIINLVATALVVSGIMLLQ